MNPLRGLLLAGSQSAWLRGQATRRRFVRRAVARFMPGESLDDALGAAASLRGGGFGTIVTQLGENVADRSEAEAVARHYLEALERIRAEELDTEVSVKLTHLGLDLGFDLASDLVARIASRARGHGKRLWIDMEGTAYTDGTLRLYRELRPAHTNLGVCVQSYLRRTAADIEALIGLGAAIRLVKGAYREPPELAFPRKRDADESFFALACRLLGDDARRAGVWLAVGTHDPRLIERITAHAAAGGIAKDAYEFALLYGIRRDQQQRLRDAGHRVRVLISYGAYWFPWYMRRLAERPANVLFVLRNALGG